MISQITATLGLMVALRLGTAGPNEPVYAGTVVFGGVGLVLTYLAFVHDEMDAGLLLKAGSVIFFVLAVVSAFWPMRPWPH